MPQPPPLGTEVNTWRDDGGELFARAYSSGSSRWIDWLTVPSDHPVRRPATIHGIINTTADKAHAAFLVMGDKILILTDSGQLVLIAADPVECKEISRAQVCAMNWCNPAYADGKL